MSINDSKFAGRRRAEGRNERVPSVGGVVDNSWIFRMDRDELVEVWLQKVDTVAFGGKR